MLICRGVARNLAMGGAKILDRKPHLLIINAEKEVIIIACAFQQIIHILSNNNEQRNFDELGVTGHWSQLLSWRERANLVVRTERFFRMLHTSSLIQREHAQTNVHLQSAFLATAPGFRRSSRTGLAVFEPPKQPTEVSTLIQTVSFK